MAVVGTGTIGMSWAASFLSRGLEVSASDPAPEAEARLRHFIDAAWPVLARLGPIAATPPHQLLTFCADPESAVAAADFVQENAPEREGDQTGAARPHRRGAAAGHRHRLQFVGAVDQPICKHPVAIPSAL